MELLNTLPVFENSQVLTASQLNSMRDYLQQQNNITRVGLIGRGIVCGLVATRNVNAYNISAGIGVSSWGFLFCLDDCELTEYKEYTIPEGTDYFPFQDNTGKQDIALFELFPSSESGKNGISPLSGFSGGNLNEYVVLLYMEEYNKDLQSCLGKSCDELGIERSYTIRKLLIKKVDLNTVNNETGNKGGYLYPGLMNIPELHLIRPFMSKEAKTNYAWMVFAYLAPVAAIGKALFDNLDSVYTAISPVLKKEYPNSPVSQLRNLWNDTLEKMTEVYLNGEAFGFQYFYDMADDAVKSLNELVCAAMHLNSQCKFNSNAFPLHLMLGNVSCPPDSYRQEFVYSPLFNEQKDWTAKVIKLFSRTADIINNFNASFFEITLKEGVFATPSKEKWQNLGERAIPVYYQPNIFEKNWNDKKCGVCYLPGKTILSYYKQIDKKGQSFESTPWLYNTNEYNFIRLEGQQGMEIDKAYASLKNISKKANIPYHTSYAFLGDLNNKYGIEGDNCCFPDLDVKYLPWRNKYLYYVRNLLNVTKKVESLFTTFSEAYNKTQKTSGYYKASYVPVESANNMASFAGNNDAVSGENTPVERTADSMDGFKKTMYNMAAFQEHYETINARNRINQNQLNIKGTSDTTNAVAGNTTTANGANQSTDFEILLGWLVDFNNCLEGMEAVLPKSFCEYDHRKFTDQYACTLNKWIALIKIARDMINSKKDPTMIPNLINLVLLYNTIAFFKDLIYIDIDTIAEMKAKRLSNIAKSKSLIATIAKHQGAEHLAGVNRNDTLLLVYYSGQKSKEDFKDIEKLAERIEKTFGKNEELNNYSKKFIELEFRKDQEPLTKLEGKVIADFTIHGDSCCDCDAEVESYDELAPQAFPRAYVINLDNRKTEIKTVYRPVNVFYHPQRFKMEVSGNSAFANAKVIEEDYVPIDGEMREVIEYTVDPAKIDKSQNLRNQLVILDEFTYKIIDKLNDSEVMDTGKISVFLYRNKIADLPTFTVDGVLMMNANSPATNYKLKIVDKASNNVVSDKSYVSGKGEFSEELEAGEYDFSFTIAGRTGMTKVVPVVDTDVHMGNIIFK